MNQLWISLQDIPAEGKEIPFTDAAIWLAPIAEFSLPYALEEGFGASVRLIPQENGCLVHGHIHGGVSVPCDRCATRACVMLNQHFDALFSLDEELQDEAHADAIRMGQDGSIEIELGTLLWEEFAVALPVKPLCTEDCKGLCSSCGMDRNQGDCDCESEQLDPRLAALQNLKVEN